jgi:hypothetical protein
VVAKVAGSGVCRRGAAAAGAAAAYQGKQMLITRVEYPGLQCLRAAQRRRETKTAQHTWQTHCVADLDLVHDSLGVGEG